MDWDVRERVHIMPVGYEYERIIDPAEHFRADRVVLIGHTEDADDSEGRQKWDRVTETLDDREVVYEEAKCNMFDLYSSLGTIAEIISKYSDDDVYVNVSTGSKMTAIAGMIASMVMGSTAYYVKAENYDEDPSEISDVTELPKYPIDAPDIEHVSLMEFIDKWTQHQGPPSKGEAIHFSEQENLPFIQKNVVGKGKYRLLDTHIIEPLKEREWIEETKQGRNKVLTLTADGEAALQAFRWMVDEDIAWEKYIEEGLDEEEIES